MSKLHIEGGTARAAAIKNYLDLIDRFEYDSVDAVMEDAMHRFGFPDPDEYDELTVDTKGMELELSRLKIVEEGNRQQLTKLGHRLVDVLITDEELFYNLLHLFYATGYLRDPAPARTFSWAYYQISSELRTRAPVDFENASQDIIETVMNTADQKDHEHFEEHGPLSNRSMTSYEAFVRELRPPVFNDDGEGETFLTREFVPPGLYLAAVDHIYQAETVMPALTYGDLIDLSSGGEGAEVLCTLCLLEEGSLTDMAEHTADMYSQLSIKSDYRLRVRLSDPIDISTLA